MRAALDLVVPAATIAQQAEAAGRARARSWAVSRMAVIRACAAAALIVRGGDLVQQAASHPHVETDHANGPKHS